MRARRLELFPRFGEMNRAQREHVGLFRQLGKRLEKKAPQHARTPRADGRIDRRYAVEMDQRAVRRIGFEHFEIGMIENEPPFFQRARAAVNDEVLAGFEDLRQVTEVEPTTADGGGRGRAGWFRKGESELATAPEIGGLGFKHRAAEADRSGRRLRRKVGKFYTVLVTPRIMTQQIAHNVETGRVQIAQLGRGHARHGFERRVPSQRNIFSRSHAGLRGAAHGLTAAMARALGRISPPEFPKAGRSCRARSRHGESGKAAPCVPRPAF